MENFHLELLVESHSLVPGKLKVSIFLYYYLGSKMKITCTRTIILHIGYILIIIQDKAPEKNAQFTTVFILEISKIRTIFKNIILLQLESLLSCAIKIKSNSLNYSIKPKN